MHRHLRRARLWLALVLGLSLGGTGQAADIAAASPRQLVAALRTGKPVVLVVANSARANPTDEAYGDWADALNNFAAHSTPEVKIIKLTARTYRLLIADPRISGQFATLFVRSLDHALLYQGMILEPQVYHLGRGYILEQTEPLPAAGYGLIPTTIRFRRGKIGTLEPDMFRKLNKPVIAGVVTLVAAPSASSGSGRSARLPVMNLCSSDFGVPATIGAIAVVAEASIGPDKRRVVHLVNAIGPIRPGPGPRHPASQ